MAQIFNIPMAPGALNLMASSIAEILLAAEEGAASTKQTDSLVMLPNKRPIFSLRQAIAEELGKNKAAALQIISYAEIADNTQSFIASSKESEEEAQQLLMPPAISGYELRILLQRTLQQLKEDGHLLAGEASLEDITRAISEYHHYQYNIESLQGGSVKEQLLAHTLIKLKSHLHSIGKILPQERQHLAAQHIQKIFAKRSIKRIFAVLPATNVLYIKKLLGEFMRLPDTVIFIQGAPLAIFQDTKIWSSIEQKHYLYYVKDHLSSLNLSQGAVRHLKPLDTALSQDVANLMCPAQFLSLWQQKSPTANAGNLKLQNVEIISAASQSEEAELICHALRTYITNTRDKTHLSIALVCADRRLTARIKQFLTVYDIAYDDSTSSIFTSYPEVQFFLLLLTLMSKHTFDPILWLSILKHPACKIAEAQPEIINKFEIECIRKMPYQTDLSCYFALCKSQGKMAEFDALYDFHSLIGRYKEHMQKADTLHDMLTLHFSLYSETTHQNIRSSQIFAELGNFLSKINSCQSYCYINSLTDYTKLLLSLLQQIDWRPEKDSNNSLCIKILTPIEARMLNFDLLIAAGMQEGVFPEYLKDHGYISHETRKSYHDYILKDLEIGYSGFDFASLLMSAKVIFSYAKSDNQKILYPSRWIERLRTYLAIKGFLCQPENTAYHQELYNKRKSVAYSPLAAPVYPFPYEHTGELKLSVGSIERLMRSPYVYYIHDILGLKPLEPISVFVSNKDFGIILHNTLAHIAKQGFVDDIKIYKEKFLKLYLYQVRDFAPLVTTSFWQERILRIAEWFFEYEKRTYHKSKVSYIEKSGQIELKLSNTLKIKLCARTDRIDVSYPNKENSPCVDIIDYKTGVIPTNAEVQAGLAPQLIIEALLLLKGGVQEIKNLPPDTQINLRYIRLCGQEKIAEEKLLQVDLEHAYQELRRLLNIFFQPDAQLFASTAYEGDYRLKSYQHITRAQECAGHKPQP